MSVRVVKLKNKWKFIYFRHDKLCFVKYKFHIKANITVLYSSQFFFECYLVNLNKFQNNDEL